MDNKLTRDEVLHVAHLARINIEEDEIEKYQMNLKQMIDEIDKIKDLNDFDEDKMWTPCEGETPLDLKPSMVCSENLLKNVPKTKGNFIEVPVMINE